MSITRLITCNLPVIASADATYHGPLGTPSDPTKLESLQLNKNDHRLLGVDHQVEQGVDSVELVVGDRSDRLLSHRALVRVSRGLVVLRVGDETGDGSEDGEGLDGQDKDDRAHRIRQAPCRTERDRRRHVVLGIRYRGRAHLEQGQLHRSGASPLSL